MKYTGREANSVAGRPGWPTDQVEYLRANYGRLHSDVIGMRIKRTAKAVQQKAWVTGIAKPRLPKHYPRAHQLSMCADDSARRLLMGMGERMPAAEIVGQLGVALRGIKIGNSK